jgi:DNA-binding response OmpR family regulator
MKTNLILIVDADADTVGFVLEAAARTGHGVRQARTSREAFQVLENELRHLDAVIVDVDPGAHGLALLEAVGACYEKPPLLVLSSLEEAYMKTIAAKHGAVACLCKPFSTEQLRLALDRVIMNAPFRAEFSWCDKWGHPCDHAVT